MGLKVMPTREWYSSDANTQAGLAPQSQRDLANVVTDADSRCDYWAMTPSQ